jgi:uncharacterized membrane protein YjjB (DUF3815 family)
MNYALSLWAGVAVLGFAMVFSVPRRTLPGIAALAILAHLVRAVMMELAGASLPVASFVAALLVGTTAAVVAPRTDQATPIYAFAPVIPLIPGTYIFTALRAVIELTEIGPSSTDAGPVVDSALVSVAIATLTVVALAVGTIAPGLLIGKHLARLGYVIPRNPGPHQEQDRAEE